MCSNCTGTCFDPKGSSSGWNMIKHQNVARLLCQMCYIYKIKWKNTVERCRSQIWQYGACALHAGYLRLQAHT